MNTTTAQEEQAHPHQQAGEPTFSAKVEIKQLVQLGWPIVLTQLFIMLTGTIDAAMAGHYSSLDLAGVSLGGMFLWPTFMLLTGLTMALTPIAAQLRGAGQHHKIGHQIRQGLWVCTATASILVLVMVNAGDAYLYLGVEPEVAAIASDYLSAAAWGAPPIIFYVALRHICEGLGRPRPPMIIAGAVIPINALLNYGFIYGNFGLPELGGVGCGYATAIVFWLELAAMLFVCRLDFFKSIKAFKAFEGPKWPTIKSILFIGTPIGLTIFVEMVVFSVVGLMIAQFGVVEVAANSIAGNINWAAYVIPAAIGSAASIRVGFHVGAQHYATARGAAMMVFKLSLVYAVIVGFLLILTRSALVSIFTTDPAVIEISMTLIIFIAVYQLVDDSNAVAIGALRGYKDTRFPMAFSLVSYWFVALPIGYALSEEILLPGLAPGVYGYWAALTLGLAIVAIAMGTRLSMLSADFKKVAKLAAT